MKSLMIAIAMSIGLPALAEEAAAPANHAQQRVNKRQEKQENRIQEGVASGELNAHEAKRLEKREKRIEKVETRAMEDGTIDKREARRLEKMQDRASKHIRRQKHDRQKR